MFRASRNDAEDVALIFLKKYFETQGNAMRRDACKAGKKGEETVVVAVLSGLIFYVADLGRQKYSGLPPDFFEVLDGGGMDRRIAGRQEWLGIVL